MNTVPSPPELDVDCVRFICACLGLPEAVALSAVNRLYREAAIPFITAATIREVAELAHFKPWKTFFNICRLAVRLSQSPSLDQLAAHVSAFLDNNKKNVASLRCLTIELASSKGFSKPAARRSLQQVLPFDTLAAVLEATPDLQSVDISALNLKVPERYGTEHERLQAALSGLASLASIAIRHYSLPWAVLKGCTEVETLVLEELDNKASNIDDLDLPAKQKLKSLHLALHAHGSTAERQIYDLSPIGHISGLEHLTLLGKAITITPHTLTQLCGLHKLQTLKLLCATEELRTEHYCAAVGALTALQDLSLPFVEVDASLWRALCALDQLQSLSCGTIKLGARDANASGSAAGAADASPSSGQAQAPPQLVHSKTLQQLDVMELQVSVALRLRDLAPALQVLHMRMCSDTMYPAALQGHEQLQVRGWGCPSARQAWATVRVVWARQTCLVVPAGTVQS